MGRKAQQDAPNALEMLKVGTWTAEQVASMTDTPLAMVVRWCTARLIHGARHMDGAWRIPGPGLVFFLGTKIEPMYSLRTAAALLDLSDDTIEEWIKSGRLKKVKLGRTRQAPVRILESELRKVVIRAE